MIAAIKDWYDALRGSGDHSISVPPMDGALSSNSKIEEAEALFPWGSPDNIVHNGDYGYFSSGKNVLKFSGKSAPILAFEQEAVVSALALSGDVLAVGLQTGGVKIIGGDFDGARFPVSKSLPLNCPTAIAFKDPKTLLVANGSSVNDPGGWRHDLLQRNAKGSIWSVDLISGDAKCLADDLAYPCGVLPLADEAVLVSEAWRARVIKIQVNRPIEAVLTDLPAYPGRLSPTRSGKGAWLPLFAPRRRIVELVMRDKKYRNRMMAEISPDYWISPSLHPMSSFMEPLQGGTLKKLAILNPWAPSRSYGLVVQLNENFQPVRSFHSRADGTRHGISSCVEVSDRLLAASTGGDVIVSINPEEA